MRYDFTWGLACSIASERFGLDANSYVGSMNPARAAYLSIFYITIFRRSCVFSTISHTAGNVKRKPDDARDRYNENRTCVVGFLGLHAPGVRSSVCLMVAYDRSFVAFWVSSQHNDVL